AKAGEIFNNPSMSFTVLNDSDFRFPMIINEAGEEVELTHGRYGKFLESRDRRVRREAFQNLYQVYDQFQNTSASLLSGNINVHNFVAEVRNFPSARAAALFENAISEDVYDNLVTTVNRNLPLLHRYIALRKQALGLEELHSYDLYVSLIEGIDVKYGFEEAQEIIVAALSPLGPEYVEIVRRAFRERWIDRADNKGKRSGAYSSGAHGTNPYILLNWQGTLDNLFTLAHELGHSVHSWYSRNTQPFIYSSYSIFLAEIASTMNENLLTDYLLSQTDDDKLRQTVINNYLDGFKGTVFRQTQFAEFEHLIYTAAAAGTPLTSAFLTEQYGEMNKRYYGEDLTFDPEIGLEWSRIPHFYLNYYVYQYATGFSAATSFAHMVKTEGQPAVDRYLQFLKAGSSDYPLSVLKKAGLDMSEVKPIEDAFAVFTSYLEQMEQLLLP
ncbi:MAG: oligoendopeptidase F, partial [Clostridiales bacterium]|nr:oligoendopeptidase F [Clostridiales bacterium]